MSKNQHQYVINNEILKGCRQILKASGVNADHTVTIATYTGWPLQHITNSYFQAAVDLGAETTILMQSQRPFTKLFEKALFETDYVIGVGVAVFPSYDPATYTNIMDRVEAEKKVGGFLYGINGYKTTEILITKYPPPNEAVVKRVYPGCELMEKAKECRFTTPAGTDLTMEIRGSRAEVGFLQPERGHVFDIIGGTGIYGFFKVRSPNTYGKIVVVAGDYPAQIVHRDKGFPYMGDKITLTVEKGVITNIEGGAGALMWQRWFDSHTRRLGNDDAYVLSHNGIGTDPRMREDFERAPFYGVAGGDGEWMDGVLNLGFALPPTGAHQDIMVRGGSAWLDGEQILDNEQWVGPLSDEVLGITANDKKSPQL
jgi:hypothetical protein